MPMTFPPLHPSQPGLVHSALPTMANTSDILRRTIHPQLTPLNGGFKDPNQVLIHCCNCNVHSAFSPYLLESKLIPNITRNMHDRTNSNVTFDFISQLEFLYLCLIGLILVLQSLCAYSDTIYNRYPMSGRMSLTMLYRWALQQLLPWIAKTQMVYFPGQIIPPSFSDLFSN